MRIHTFYILPIMFFFALGVVNAPAVFAQEEGNGETDQTAQTEEAQTQNAESAGQAEQDEGGFLNSLLFWQNWGPPDAPTEPSQWHDSVRKHLNVEDDEYIRYGYTRINETWLPIFFLRRFKMMDKQYVHTLIIQGQPKKSPKIKGIKMGKFGMEVSNLGFDVRMPKFPSVSREQKGRDEKEAVQLCTIQLDLYGFDEIEWLPGEEEELRNLADTWNTE